MSAKRKPVDHGAAIRVPPAHDTRGWQILTTWVGESGRSTAPGLMEVSTPTGADTAAPGDWIVLSATGSFYVTRPR